MKAPRCVWFIAPVDLAVDQGGQSENMPPMCVIDRETFDFTLFWSRQGVVEVGEVGRVARKKL